MHMFLKVVVGLAVIAPASLAQMAAAQTAADVPAEVSTLAGQQITLHVYPFLGESDLKTLRLVATNKQALQLFITSKGHSAIAVSPDEGFAPEGVPAPSAVAIGDFSDAATAASEATKACDDKRTGKAPCVVILEVGPIP
ncbi:MAG: hypothetical protein H7245_05825 [Candidatus Saccharibacteria bacterium]|nr:hypothetical protein [Pseudorhodobacter sp.]